jgi:Cof subfamily protein (haloacid dehalogenase superfamily)
MNIPDFKTLPRAVAIDLDGTLLNSRTELSERNHRALEPCIAHGIPIIIATSRPTRIFNRIFPQDLRQKCSYIVMSGAVAKGNPPLSGNYKEQLSDTVIRGVIDCAKTFDSQVHIVLEIDGYEFGVNWALDYSMLWQINSATPDMVLTLEEAMKRKPCKVALGNTDIFRLGEQLSRKFGDSISVVAAKISNPLLNVTAKTATKPNALNRLLKPQGISLNEVLAFGDDLPDLDMLEACGISVAMANAFSEVKAVCKYQTASNDEDGVAMVLEKMLRIIT